jgi:ribosome-associated protein
VVVLDLRRFSYVTDYFVICSGRSTIHVRSLADALIEGLGKMGIDAWHIEGYEHSLWVLLDYGDVVVHLFHEPLRSYYNLERLWGDADVVPLEESEGSVVTKRGMMGG